MILGISGKKQSGKTTSGNFIASLFMANLGISEKIHIDDNGDIVISDLFGDKNYAGKFDIINSINSTDYLINKALDTLNPNIRLYSFADPLKRDICINILGLTHQQCYGSDIDKNGVGQLKFSSDGNYLAYSNASNLPSVHIMDFNAETGILTRSRTINRFNANTYGIEFSPNCKYLY